VKPTPAVVYLWVTEEAAHALDSAERRCREYAEGQRWLVVEVVREVGGDEYAPHRDGLQRVYHTLKLGRAVAVITPDIAMLGGDEATRNRVAEIIEGADCQGFIVVPT
jgi:hypothetical protein